MEVQYEELTNKINIMILKNKKENKDVNIKNIKLIIVKNKFN